LFRCYSWCWNGLTRHKGLRSFESRARALRTKGTCSGFRAWAGRESEAWKEKALEGQNPRRVSAAGEGKPDLVANGLAGGSEASKQVKLAERGGSAGTRPRETGKRASARGKGTHSRRGNQATGVKASGVGETGGERIELCVPARRWITAREPGCLERGKRSPVRGRL